MGRQGTPTGASPATSASPATAGSLSVSSVGKRHAARTADARQPLALGFLAADDGQVDPALHRQRLAVDGDRDLAVVVPAERSGRELALVGDQLGVADDDPRPLPPSRGTASWKPGTLTWPCADGITMTVNRRTSDSASVGKCAAQPTRSSGRRRPGAASPRTGSRETDVQRDGRRASWNQARYSAIFALLLGRARGACRWRPRASPRRAPQRTSTQSFGL